jgi:TonB family protein
MTSRAAWLWLVPAVVALAATASAQEPATAPAVVLSRIEITYPPIAESARVQGQVRVEVGVRPDGSVGSTTLVHGTPLLREPAFEAASRASFDCRGCTERSTPHTIVFAFVLDGPDTSSKPVPPTWGPAADGSSEVKVSGRLPIVSFGPNPPFHLRAARCLWLWHCSRQAYIHPMM